ncbi:MAG TPA: ThiF family adenylyltransferase, partial [Terriglobales bacterium]|nr:ThiF family adenylyltransferase [Terriglobales bacterium]
MTSLELDPKLDPEPNERYSRQVLFPGIGADGQRKLSTSRIAIVGCGATGSA